MQYLCRPEEVSVCLEPVDESPEHTVGSCHVVVVGNVPRSFARATSGLNHRAISLVSGFYFLRKTIIKWRIHNREHMWHVISKIFAI